MIALALLPLATGEGWDGVDTHVKRAAVSLTPPSQPSPAIAGEGVDARRSRGFENRPARGMHIEFQRAPSVGAVFLAFSACEPLQCLTLSVVGV